MRMLSPPTKLHDFFLKRDTFLDYLRKLLCSCLFLAVSVIVGAQDNKIKFETYSTKEGLAQSSVVSIFQDDESFMWFGTYAGLSRFDGYSFKPFQYNKLNEKSISDNHVRSICQDTAGILWVGTTYGLNRFFTHEEEFVRFMHDSTDTNSISHNTVYKVFKDRDGDIWAGTWGGGLELIEIIPGNYKSEKEVKFRFRHFLNFTDSGNMYRNHISDIAQGHDGSIYASAYGLYRINKNTGEVKAYLHDPSDINSLSGNYISAVCADKNGYIWAGTWEGGLNRIDPETDSVIRFFHNPSDPNSLSHDVIMSLFSDNAGTVWVGTWGGGLNRIVSRPDQDSRKGMIDGPDAYIFHRFVHDENDITSISGNSVYSIYEDNTGTMWAGTDWSGVNKFNPGRVDFEHIYYRAGTKNTLINNIVHTLYFDSKDYLWIGTQEGLNRYNPATDNWNLYRNDPANPNSISFDHVRTIVEDINRNIWVGTLKGLNRYIPEKEGFERYYINEDDPGSTNNLALHASSDGTLWIGNYSGGLFKLDTKTGLFKVYDHIEGNPSTISDNQVWSIAEDEEGFLWIGTGKGGICRFDPVEEKFSCFQSLPGDSTGLKSNTVWVLYFDHRGDLWVGTSSGANKVKYARDGRLYFQNCFAGTPLENIGITGIVEDADHNLWITSARGLSCYNLADSSLIHYGVEDGLQDEEFSINALVRDEKTNMIYAGGVNGFNRFNPREITGNSAPPAVKIVDLKLFNESVHVGDTINGRLILPKTISALRSINLSYKEYVITFEYAALHYKSPEGNKYAFRLEGFENNWNYVGSQRSATYTNLDPGDYTFRVIASNSDDKWNEEGVALKIHIAPPFWKTFWFKLLAILGLSGLLFLFYSLRVAQIKNQNIVLERTVAERTRELNAKNILLIRRTEELDETNEQLTTSNKKLSELNSMKNKFFSIIGHDLKNPINAIMGFSQLLQMKVDKISREKRDNFITNIKSASEKTFHLLEDLLEWARSQSGKYQI